MTQVFADTSAFYALADRKDPAHARAKEFLEANEAPLLTNNYVFAETMSLLTKRLGKASAATFGAGLRASELIRILHLDVEYEEAAWREFLRFRDKDFDFVDSTCFAVMEKQGIEAAFAFDRHFAQRGFRALP
ncbi:MAG: PIN domain-containing protein [Elusimicrobia bacterium]|nr:PIN domain-containing protein [Elusimicrobiota bacterium]